MYKYTYKIILRGDRVRANGMQPLVLQAFINGDRVRVGLNVEVRPDEFDSVRMQVKSKADPGRAQKINALLAKVKSRVEDMFFESLMNDTPLTVAKFEEEFDRKPAMGDFLVWMRQEIDKSVESHAVATRKNYNTTHRWLTKYRAKIAFGDLTFDFVSGWDAFLRKQKLDANTAAKYHRVLRKFVLLARRKGKRLPNPYAEFKFKEVSKERTFLNAAEVAQLRALYDRGELKPYLQNTLRHFLFQIGTSLRYSDLAAMRRENVEGGMLIFVPLKTKRVGKIVKVPLSRMALRLLEDSESADDRLFWVYKEQVMNRFLKMISDFFGGSKRLTTHVARHTFGYLFIAAGGQVEVLQKIMGHSDIKTTMIYTHIDTSQIRAGVDQLDVFLSTTVEDA